MAFDVGQKVVCVNAGYVPGMLGEIWVPGEELFEGRVYTVRRVFPDDFGNPALWLDEVSRSRWACMRWGTDNIGYGQQRFRPLVSKPTDISVFREILRDVERGRAREIEDA